MKAALTVWDGRVSPVFDVSREALILTIEHGIVLARSHETIDMANALGKIDRLAEVGIETLICGAISEPVQHELTLKGIKVIGFVAGEVDEIVESFLAGNLPTPRLSMPGCCRKQNRFHGGRADGSGEGRGTRRGCGRKGRS
jgi:predicted Fe-Mo cluster-binding NifX family protein